MTRSMTGFGRGEASTGRFAIHVTLRSVNNRGLRLGFNIADRLQGMEVELDRLVRSRISRGTVSVVVGAEEPAGAPGYMLDAKAIRYYREAFRALQDDLGVEERVPMSVLATLPGAVRKGSEPGEISEELRAGVRQATQLALDGLIRVREEEGGMIWKETAARCERITELIDKVHVGVPAMVEAYRVRLSGRLSKLLESVDSSLREEDLRREVAVYADRSDISEEIARLRTYLDMIRQLENSEGSVGRRLEFIAQEMFREANTMASKAGDAKIAQATLDIKAEIEKLREQAMNVE